MYRIIDRSGFEPINSGIAKHAIDLRARLDSIRLDEILSRNVDTAEVQIQNELEREQDRNELRREAGRALIEASVIFMLAAIDQDSQQLELIERYTGDKTQFPFDHYVSTSLPSEQMAQEGLEFQHTAALRFVEEIDFIDSKARGDDMQVHIPIPADLVLDETTDAFVVAEWLRGTEEVYLRYTHQSDEKPTTTMYRVSEEGFHEYTPIGETDFELELEFQLLMERAQNSMLDYMEIEMTIDFYEKVGAMKLFPFE